jgi:soluble cytochrome b562
MNKYTDLIQMLEKIFGKGSVSRTIGTRTNVVRFPKGKQPIDPTRGEFDVEGTAVKNPDLVQTIENSIEDRMGDITKMNDQELLTYTSNVRRLLNFKEPPIQNADVVKFGSGEEIKGEGLEQLIQKQGTKNPPTTVAGRLETQGKKLEKAGEDLKEITEPKSVIGDIIKDYGDFDKYMQSSQKTGYVRATVRQIMREDIQAGKLKLPKELQDQVMQGIGEPIDIYRKVYGEGALEQIDSLADDLGQFRTEEEAAKFARSKYQMEPKLEPVDESMTYDELGNLIKKGPDEPEGKADGGRIGYAKGKRVKSSIDKLIDQLNKKTQGKKSMESVNPKTGEVTVPKKPIRRAEEPTGVTVMDVEPEIVDERSIKKTKSRQLTREEIEDYSEQLGDTETWLSEGTVEEAEKALKRRKAEEAYYYGQYKMGKLDPAPGEQTEARMKFLQKKLEEAEMTKDRRLISPSEIDELMSLEDTFAKDLTQSGEQALENEMNKVLNQYDKSMFIKDEQGMVDVSNPANAEKMALLLKRDHPEIYNKIFKLTEDINQKQTLDEFDITGREPNAKGGIAGLL